MTQSDETCTDSEGKKTSCDGWPLTSSVEGENETGKADSKADYDPNQAHVMFSVSGTEQDRPDEQERQAEDWDDAHANVQFANVSSNIVPFLSDQMGNKANYDQPCGQVKVDNW